MAQTSFYTFNDPSIAFQYYGQMQQASTMDYQCRLPADYTMDSTYRKSSYNSGNTTRGISPKSERKRNLHFSNSPRVDCEHPQTSQAEEMQACFQYHCSQGWSNHLGVPQKSSMYHKEPRHAPSTSSSSHRNVPVNKTQAIHTETASEDTKIKFKTELCRNFEIEGRCKFGSKCSFAHGMDELLNKKHINLHYKSKKCNKFFENGFCEYGSRCQYLHKEDSFTHILDSYCEKLLVWIERNPTLDMCSIMNKTHTFGHRNSFFERLEKSELSPETEAEATF